MYSRNTLALAVAPLLLAAHARSIGLDLDDVPNECKAICRPVTQLSDQCDVDLRSDIDRDEDRLTAQCICTNNSFDVGKFAGLCASCMHQNFDKGRNNNRDGDDDDDDDDDNRADRDDIRDIDNIVNGCGFKSTSYAASASNEASSVTVSASRLTDISQLTSTLADKTDASGRLSSPTSGPSSGSKPSSGATTAATTATRGTGSQTTTPSGTRASQSGSGTAASPTNSDSAASSLVPGGSSPAGLLYAAGAFVIGGLALVL